MFDHIEFTVADLVTARQTYGGILKALGCREVFYEAGMDVGFGKGPVTHLLLAQGAATVPAMHICFSATSKAEVEAAYAAAIDSGATCNGKPGYRPDYAPGYYAAFVHDADGHNLEILYREPQ